MTSTETGEGGLGLCSVGIDVELMTNVQLSRYDVELDQVGNEMDIPQVSQLTHKPKDRDDLLREYGLPTDSIIKLKYGGNLIPWSMVQSCTFEQGQLLDIQVFHPHQTIKPKLAESFPSDSLIREKVHRLELRIISLEEAVDPACMDIKTEKDLQLLTKQISFLKKRLEEADQAEWIKKSAT